MDTREEPMETRGTVNTDETSLTEDMGVADKKEDPKLLDLAFAMDCTGSMGSYILSARQNIQRIVEEVVSAEKADVRLALVEYRDHPPQDSSFVTNVHDFTGSVRKMKEWLDQCSANGGGDHPEAVADALLQVLKLNWRSDATKVCVFIADAPPHGLGGAGDGFPNGCPDNIDPMEVTNRLSEKGVSLYTVGCEPSILGCKDFFMGLAHLTGGQYVPLGAAHLLTKVIIGGIREEISLQQLMEEVNLEVRQQFEADPHAEVTEEALTHQVHMKLQSKGARAKKLRHNNADLPEANVVAQQMSSCADMGKVRELQSKACPEASRGYSTDCREAAPRSGGGIGGFFGRMFNRKSAAPPPPPPMGGSEYERNIDDSPMFSTMSASMGPPPPPMMAASPAPMMNSASASDTYECVEDEISEQQVQRMVQKSVWTNNLNTRYKKKH